MKIFVINPNWNAYSETWLLRMMRYFRDSIVGIACFDPKEKQWENGAPSFNLYGKPFGTLKRIFWKFPFLRTYLKPNMDRDLMRFVKKTNPDILFVNFLTTAIHVKETLIKLNLPVFIHVHGFDIFWDATHESSQLPVHSTDYVDLVKQLINDTDNLKFISNSELASNELRKIGIKDKHIKLKYFGVPIDNEIKKFNVKQLSVLYLGRFADFKGPELVLEAFIKACENGFNGNLTMVGDGTLKPMCRLLAVRSKFSNRIFFKDPVDPINAIKYFQEADIYTMHNCHGILSNQPEAFGVTIIEAMSHGTPVITGRSGGPIEIITNQVDGFLVEPGNIDEHAAVFLKLQEDPELLVKISNNARETVANKFSDILEKKGLQNIFDTANE